MCEKHLFNYLTFGKPKKVWVQLRTDWASSSFGSRTSACLTGQIAESSISREGMELVDMDWGYLGADHTKSPPASV